MREFVLFSRKGFTTPKFNPLKLELYGRLDLVARCLISSFSFSRGLRRDVVFHLLLYGPSEPPKYVRIEWKDLRGVLLTEVNVGYLLKEILEGKRGLVRKMSFQEVIRSLSSHDIYVLHEDGVPIDSVDFGEHPIFVIGDHIGLSKKDERFVERFARCKISLGKVSYLSSQVITIINYVLDKRLSRGRFA